MPTHDFSLTLQATPEVPDADIRPGQAARRHVIEAEGKPSLEGSSASVFHGEPGRWNPEELFIAALAQCHYLSVVFVAQSEGIELHDYRCEARGILEWDSTGAGQMAEVVLEPAVVVGSDDLSRMEDVHQRAHELCFIARSVNCVVTVNPRAIPAS